MRTWFARCRVLRDPFIISHSVLFVKGFFKSFFNFFRGFQPLACPFGFLAEVFDIISHSLAFVKRIFKSFFNFFRDIPSAVLGFRPRKSALGLYHIFLILSRDFLKVFFNFFRDILSCFNVRSLARSPSSTAAVLLTAAVSLTARIL